MPNRRPVKLRRLRRALRTDASSARRLQIGSESLPTGSAEALRTDRARCVGGSYSGGSATRRCARVGERAAVDRNEAEAAIGRVLGDFDGEDVLAIDEQSRIDARRNDGGFRAAADRARRERAGRDWPRGHVAAEHLRSVEVHDGAVVAHEVEAQRRDGGAVRDREAFAEVSGDRARAARRAVAELGEAALPALHPVSPAHAHPFELPTRRRVVQRVLPAGGGESVVWMICSTTLAGTAWSLRPPLGRSASPSTPPAKKRARIRETCCSEMPTRFAISRPETPSALSRIDRKSVV